MTEERLIALAKQAGWEYAHGDRGFEPLWRFAELVRADEREACAKVAQSTVCDTHIPTGVKIYGTAAAKAIRARSTK